LTTFVVLQSFVDAALVHQKACFFASTKDKRRMGLYFVQIKFGISIAVFNHSKICWALDFAVPRDGTGVS